MVLSWAVAGPLPCLGALWVRGWALPQRGALSLWLLAGPARRRHEVRVLRPRKYVRLRRRSPVLVLKHHMVQVRQKELHRVALRPGVDMRRRQVPPLVPLG